MNLQEAISALEAVRNALESAVKEVADAALSDDKTPLLNALALRISESQVGIGGDNPNVVIFGDLNNLKGLNDQYGYSIGDAAISHVGELIDKLFVKECGARAFHRSGDEFVILLSSSSLEQFKTKVSSFASCTFKLEDVPYKTAMSFGYAVSQGETGYADLIARAEIACQVAKTQGGGACIEWTEKIKQANNSLRDRCTNCGTKISCIAPEHAIPPNRQLLCCPCCGESLPGNESPSIVSKS